MPFLVSGHLKFYWVWLTCSVSKVKWLAIIHKRIIPKGFKNHIPGINFPCSQLPKEKRKIRLHLKSCTVSQRLYTFSVDVAPASTTDSFVRFLQECGDTASPCRQGICFRFLRLWVRARGPWRRTSPPSASTTCPCPRSRWCPPGAPVSGRPGANWRPWPAGDSLRNPSLCLMSKKLLFAVVFCFRTVQSTINARSKKLWEARPVQKRRTIFGSRVRFTLWT